MEPSPRHSCSGQVRATGASWPLNRRRGGWDSAFGSLVQKGVDALFVTNDALFFNRRVQIVILAAYHRLPAIYALRELVEIGGLASYGSDFVPSAPPTSVACGRCTAVSDLIAEFSAS